MFSERLENLIKAALQDGVLTEQEKESIIKRAQAEGEDVDEVDIYIQSLVQKRQQELAKEAQEAETERIVAQKKERDARMASELEEQKQRDNIMRKCPVCGGRIPALSSVCPNCQHVIKTEESDDNMMRMMKKISVASGHLHYWYPATIGFDDDEKYDYYYPMLTELENLYGELPKVQQFILKEKKKRLGILSKYCMENIQDNDSHGFKEAKLILTEINNSYGTMPEAQALISDYQEQLDKKMKKKKLRKIGCLVLIVLFLILLFVSFLLQA